MAEYNNDAPQRIAETQKVRQARRLVIQNDKMAGILAFAS